MKRITFDNYEDYVTAQVKKNHAKLSWVNVSKKELNLIGEYIKQHIKGASFGLCHGVRNGTEVAILRRYLGVEVIGTDIADTATSFPHVIQWDFHEVDPRWLNQVDFIYSNAWDHSYDFALLMDRWMSCIKPDKGRCFLQYSDRHSEDFTDEADCFGLSLEELNTLIQEKYEIEKVLSFQEIPPGASKLRRIAAFFATEKYGRKIHVVVVKHRSGATQHRTV